jgi:Tfp pilus assembly protein PilF
MNSKEGHAMRMEGRDRFGFAISLLQAQDLAGAEKNLLKVLKKQPGHVGALNTLAILLAQSGRHAQAERYFLQAIQIFPSSDATYYNYGHLEQCSILTPDWAQVQVGSCF